MERHGVVSRVMTWLLGMLFPSTFPFPFLSHQTHPHHTSLYMNPKKTLITSYNLFPTPSIPHANETPHITSRIYLNMNSALQAYKLNGNANGYQMPELTNVIDDQGQTGDIYFENGIQTPGLTTIPICDIETISSNWQNHGRSSSKPAGYLCS